MAYRFKLREPLGKGVRRIGLEQIEQVEAKLRAEDDVATAVHDARRCLKRLRALLRLIRPGLEAEVYRNETQRIAQVGRMLAGARDRFVMCQTVARVEKATGPLGDDCAAKIIALITDGHDLTAPPDAETRREALRKLGISRKFFSGSTLRGLTMTDVWEGLEKSYRKNRQACKEAYRRPTDENFHAWRKAVQQHWRHMSLLSRAWPEAMTARAAEAKAISQILGEDHDLAVLVAFVSQNRDKLPEEAVDSLVQHAKSAQKDLRALAKLHGDRLLLEKPEDLVGRISGYWDATKDLLRSEDHVFQTSGGPTDPGAVASAPPASGEQAADVQADDANAPEASPPEPEEPIRLDRLTRRSVRKRASA
jgi:CHAD domain-containing protein